MARPQSSPILAQLRNAKTYPEQTEALQALKNEIVGHVQKKEAWVSLGVLEPIVGVLSSARSTAKSSVKDARLQLAVRPLSEEDGMRLQALELIASFAKGGPPFLQPLHASRALPAVLTCISPSANPPQIVVAALKALADIADASALALPSSPLDIKTLADNIFASSQHLESLCLMFSSTSSKYHQQFQIALASDLICRLCREERHQHALATSGVLDMLAVQLASFVVAQGHAVPGAEELAYSDGLFEVIPDPAHPCAKVGPILDAIATILGDSKYRATRLVKSPAILAIFPSIKFEPSAEVTASRKSSELIGLGGSRHQNVTAMEYLLPAVPPIPRSRKGVPPPQTSINTSGRSDAQTSSRAPSAKIGSSVWDSSNLQTFGHNGDSADEIESPLIPWLLLQARSSQGYERLMATAVLVALFKAGLGRKVKREASLALLIVPILVELIYINDKDGHETNCLMDPTQSLILERAPAVLARLITDSEFLQKSAFECSAAQILTKLLKRAYQPVPALEQSKSWSPQPDTTMDVEDSSTVSQLGQGGQNPLLVHRLRLRESALKAIGALASGKEDYRKALVLEDFVPFVVESLSEFPRKPRQIKDRPKDKPSGESNPQASPAIGYGTNPLSVIIAGCHVVRMLARSINILRTCLVDHAVALPIFRYLKHPDVNVQIAATATICNLVVEVSPVRELLAENGVMKILCEHAHSENPALRLNALWALKHFVVAVSPELKRACLEQLGPGWLVQLICDDSQDAALYNASSKQSPGDDGDEEMDAPSSDEPFRWLYAANGCLRELDASRSTRLRQAEDRLASLRESELNPVRRARNDDVAIQEQGLDFIRNLIGPGSGIKADSPCETTDMIDYLFSTLGQERFFEILASKLRARVLHPFSRRTYTSGRETRVLHPHAKIIEAVILLLVHIAASISRHRQLVVAQTELLKLLCQQASSKDKEVRVALCHMVINLTEQEEDGEMQACSQRARELQKLGFQTKMETMVKQDRDLDVKERARTAVYQLEHAAAY